MRLLGIYIDQENISSFIRKTLKESWYPFYGNINYPPTSESIKPCFETEIPDLYEIKSSVNSKLKVSLSCIVGKNGSGKSTLLDIMLAIINNFASTHLKQMVKSYGVRLHGAAGVYASLFYELDHNMPKSLYPYLCTNFYNLLPCCSSCNKHKSNRPLAFTLYAQAGEELDPLYFELPPDDLVKFQTKHNCGGLHVELHDKGDGTLAKEFNNRFAIDAVYKEHSEEIRELLWRHKIYSPSAIQALNDSVPGLFADGFNIDRFVLGTYTESKEVFKRPLTIMKQDIKKQL